MTPEQQAEFDSLWKRYNDAKQYEQNKYMSDTPEGQAWALESICQIMKRLSVFWDVMAEAERQKYIKDL